MRSVWKELGCDGSSEEPRRIGVLLSVVMSEETSRWDVERLKIENTQEPRQGRRLG